MFPLLYATKKVTEEAGNRTRRYAKKWSPGRGRDGCIEKSPCLIVLKRKSMSQFSRRKLLFVQDRAARSAFLHVSAVTRPFSIREQPRRDSLNFRIKLVTMAANKHKQRMVCSGGNDSLDDQADGARRESPKRARQGVETSKVKRLMTDSKSQCQQSLPLLNPVRDDAPAPIDHRTADLSASGLLSLESGRLPGRRS